VKKQSENRHEFDRSPNMDSRDYSPPPRDDDQDVSPSAPSHNLQAGLLDSVLNTLLHTLDAGASTCDHCEDLRDGLASMARNYRRHLGSHQAPPLFTSPIKHKRASAPASFSNKRSREAPPAQDRDRDAIEAIEHWVDQKIASVSTRGHGVRISRKVFLKEHVNVVLEAKGCSPWTSRSRLYQEWFLPVLLQLSREDIASGSPWMVKWKS
jgi:hypothetical protein